MHCGEALMAIGKEERALVGKAEAGPYAAIKETADFTDALKKERTKMENAATDMDGARIKAKSDGANVSSLFRFFSRRSNEISLFRPKCNRRRRRTRRKRPKSRKWSAT